MLIVTVAISFLSQLGSSIIPFKLQNDLPDRARCRSMTCYYYSPARGVVLCAPRGAAGGTSGAESSDDVRLGVDGREELHKN